MFLCLSACDSHENLPHVEICMRIVQGKTSDAPEDHIFNFFLFNLILIKNYNEYHKRMLKLLAWSVEPDSREFEAGKIQKCLFLPCLSKRASVKPFKIQTNCELILKFCTFCF